MHHTRMTCGLVCLVLGILATAIPAQPNDEATQLARLLKQCPEADANKDGRLTRQEWGQYAVAMQKAKDIAALADKATVVPDVQFAEVDGIALKLDLYLPKAGIGDRGLGVGDGLPIQSTIRNPLVTAERAVAGQSAIPKPPLVVWIHGGGWSGGSKDRCLLTWLAAEGYAVASVSYRLSWQAKFPAQIHDCKGAIRWLRAHADEYGYDATRIAAGGESAGGHLCSLLGTSGGVKELEGSTAGHGDQSSGVQNVIEFYGAGDLPKFVEERSYVASLEQLFGKPWSEAKDTAKLASPVTHLSPDDPPMLIIHGTDDPIVPVNQAEHLHNLYQKAGLVSQLEIIQGAKHTGPQFTDETRKQLIRDFLVKHLKTAN